MEKFTFGMEKILMDMKKFGMMAWSRPATPTPPPDIRMRMSPPLAVSLRLGHIAALTVRRTVIHYRDAASLPRGGDGEIAV